MCTYDIFLMCRYQNFQTIKVGLYSLIRRKRFFVYFIFFFGLSKNSAANLTKKLISSSPRPNLQFIDCERQGINRSLWVHTQPYWGPSFNCQQLKTISVNAFYKISENLEMYPFSLVYTTIYV